MSRPELAVAVTGVPSVRVYPLLARCSWAGRGSARVRDNKRRVNALTPASTETREWITVARMPRAAIVGGLVVLALVALTAGAFVGSSDSAGHNPGTKPDRAVRLDLGTRIYVSKLERCSVPASDLLLELRSLLFDVRGDTSGLSRDAEDTRATCETMRLDMRTIDTELFDDQAKVALRGIDGVRRGTISLIAYLHGASPVRLAAARNKLLDGAQALSDALRSINALRQAQGLPAVG